MDQSIYSLEDFQYFTMFDAYSGCWKMNICNQDRHKTTFVRHAGVFHCVGMLFDLTNAPVCFQRALDVILTNYKCNICLLYLYNVFAFLKQCILPQLTC